MTEQEAIKLMESEVKLLWEELDKLTKVVKVMSDKLKKAVFIKRK